MLKKTDALLFLGMMADRKYSFFGFVFSIICALAGFCLFAYMVQFSSAYNGTISFPIMDNVTIADVQVFINTYCDKNTIVLKRQEGVIVALQCTPSAIFYVDCLVFSIFVSSCTCTLTAILIFLNIRNAIKKIK